MECLFSILSPGARKSVLFLFLIPVFCHAQDVIINKNGDQWNVRIIKEYDDSVHFSYYFDSSSTVRNINKKYIDYLVREKGYHPMPLDKENGMITYSGIIDVTGKTSAELYQKGRKWLSGAFYPVQTVFETEDEKDGIIIAKGSIPYIYNNRINHPSGGNVQFTFSLYFKDGKYKYSVSGFTHTGKGSIPTVGPLEQVVPPKKDRVFSVWVFNNNWNKLKVVVDDKITGQIESLRKFVSDEQKPESW
jgi:hypothetical protein